MPFNTDLLIAERVATAAVTRVGAELDVWLLPSLAYTKSNEHAWSAGTIWLSATTLLAVLDDIGRCVAMTPARKLVFMNGHGGNSALVGVANREIRLHHGLMTFLAHPGVPPDQGGHSPEAELGMGIHGGTEETSLMLHLAPELVDMSVATRNVPEIDGHEPLRAVRWQCRVRLAVERLRSRRTHRRPDDGHRRTGRGALQCRRRRVLWRARRDRRIQPPDRVMTVPIAAPIDLRIDIDRLLGRIAELGEVGRIDGPNGEWGNARLALTDTDRAGRELVVGWMKDLGLTVSIDAIGNVFATRAGSDPTRPR